MVLMSPIPLHLTPSKPFYLFAFCYFCNIFRILKEFTKMFLNVRPLMKNRCVSAYSCNKNNAYVWLSDFFVLWSIVSYTFILLPCACMDNTEMRISWNSICLSSDALILS